MAREIELLYGDALVELGVVGPDRAVSAEDGEEIARIYQSVWYLLESMGLTTWDIDGPIPNPVAVPLSWVLAFHAARPFGITGQKLIDLQAKGQLGGPTPSLGERLLRKLSAPPYIPKPMAAVDY